MTAATTSSLPPDTAEPDANRGTIILAALLAAGLIFSVVQTAVAPALPALADAYGALPGDTTWVLTAFLLASSVATPLAGRLGDLVGRTPVLVGVLSLFAVGSAIAALGTSLGVVIIGRVVQGLGGGLFPLSFGILRETLEPRRVPGAIGLFSAMFGIGGGLGLPLSGVVVENLGVSYLFWPGVLALPAGLAIRRLTGHAPMRRGVRVDWWGAIVLSAALSSLLLGLSQSNAWGWASPGVVGLLAAGVLGLGVWMLIERRVRAPLVELRLMRRRPVLMANLAGLAVGFAMFSSFLLVPQYLQAPTSTGYGLGLTLTAAGLVMLPAAVVQLVLAPFAGLLARRISSRFPLIVGASAIVISFAVLIFAHDRVAHFVAATAVLGVGLAFSMAAMANVVVESVPRGDVGIATGLNQISRTIGGALGTQVVTTVVTVQLVSGHPVKGGYVAAFAVGAALGLAAVAAALAIPARRAGLSQPVEPAAAEVPS